MSHLAPSLPSFPRGRITCAEAWGWWFFLVGSPRPPPYSSNWKRQQPDPTPVRVQLLGDISERAWVSCCLSPNSSPLLLMLSVLSGWNRMAEVLQKVPVNRWSQIFKAWFVAQPLPLSQLKLAPSSEELCFTSERINKGWVSSAARHLAALMA